MWKMCISFIGNVGQVFVVGGIKFFFDYMVDIIIELEWIKSKNLKNNVLQLFLCEKIIFVNIQWNFKEGLLCVFSLVSCCYVI